ncbi:hypothetical protein DFH09DRAFT_1311213 [Mycena vulgaris]|nr:hypothetical protein DFH09DRAFT_1311213 [Mycena vulgaris]
MPRASKPLPLLLLPLSRYTRSPSLESGVSNAVGPLRSGRPGSGLIIANPISTFNTPYPDTSTSASVATDSLQLLMSPAPQALPLPFSMVVAGAVVSPHVTISAGPSAPTHDADVELFPPLPEAGDELTTDADVANRRAQKGKAKDLEPESSTPVAPRRPSLPVNFIDVDAFFPPDAPSPIDDDPMGSVFLEATDSIGVGASFVERHRAADEYLAQQTCLAIARSLIPTRHGAPEPSSEGASSSKRPSDDPESPSKRVCAGQLAPEVDDSARVTRAAARVAAATHSQRPVSTAGPIFTAPAPAAAAAAPADDARAEDQDGPRFEYLTKDGNLPRLFITQTPPGGWPVITGIDRLTLLDCVAPVQLAAWNQEQRPSSLVTVAGGSTDPQGEARCIRAALTGAFNAPLDSFRVAAAAAPNNTGQHPNVFFVTCSEFLNQLLQIQHVVCAPDITFFIFPVNPRFSGFMGTIAELDFPNTEQGHNDAGEEICRCISEDQSFMQQILTHRDALPCVLSVDDILGHFLESIYVSPIELSMANGPRIAYRVFTAVTTHDVTNYQSICVAFSRIDFSTPFNFRGIVR